jgi:chromate reductase
MVLRCVDGKQVPCPDPPARVGASRTGENMSYTVGYFVGSLSSTSINRRLATALQGVAPKDLDFVEIPIRDLPLYSPDFDAEFPTEAQDFKAAIAQQSLRGVLSYCNARQMTAPEAYIHFVEEDYADDGSITNPSTEKFLRGFMTEFRDHIERVLTVLPRPDADDD